MITSELLKFIRSKRKEGVSFQETEKELLKKGWGKDDINAAKKNVYFDTITKTKQEGWIFLFLIALHLFCYFFIILYLDKYTSLGRCSGLICLPQTFVIGIFVSFSFAVSLIVSTINIVWFHWNWKRVLGLVLFFDVIIYFIMGFKGAFV